MQNLIMSYKMLIITGISNEEINALTIYIISCRNVTIFYQQELPFLFKVQEKLKEYRSSKLIFQVALSLQMTVMLWLHLVVFSEHDILHF